MLKKLLLTAMLALGLSAASLEVESKIENITIKDQIEKEHK